LCLIIIFAFIVAAVNMYATSTANTPGVEGTVRAYNVAGGLRPVEGAFVEARRGSAREVVSSVQTRADGTFSLQLDPGDYNITVSASPPASNISPAYIVGYALAYVTPAVTASVANVNVTARPLLERDLGGSCLTDDEGFFNLTVRPYYPLKSYSTLIHVPEDAMSSIEVELAPINLVEPSEFYITFTHPEYPVGPEYPINHILEIWPGQSYTFEGLLSTWSPIVATTYYQGDRFSPAVNGNSTAWNLRFDTKNRLFNFTIGETYRSKGKVAEFVVFIPKKLLDGSPVVLVDNRLVPSTFTENATHYLVRFDYMLTQNEVTVGGSNTIPENISPVLSFVIAVTLLHLILRRERKVKKVEIRAQSA
jgi:hypothetical protein